VRSVLKRTAQRISMKGIIAQKAHFFNDWRTDEEGKRMDNGPSAASFRSADL